MNEDAWLDDQPSWEPDEWDTINANEADDYRYDYDDYEDEEEE